MNLRLPKRIALLIAALLFASCGGSSAPPLEAAASAVVVEKASSSLGFDVDRHGWTFENYAASEFGRFGVADAVALFGDAAVCVEDKGGCTPTPAAAEWIDMVASSMEYGMCEGMTVASVDRFLVGADPETGLLALNGNIERQLARLFAIQFLDDVIIATERWRDRSVAEIVTELQTSLADPSAEQYTLGVYSKVGGHSVLPYAVDLDAAGRGVVYVYDPNWPGEERYIEVDTRANRWRFSYFSSDQVDDPEAWMGGSELMDLTPLSVREAPFAEPFKGSGTGVKQLLAISSSTRNWTLTTADGVLDGESVVPGRDGVVAITRGAPLDRGSQRTDLVLVEWTETAELNVEDGAAKLSLFTNAGAGSVVVSDEATIKVEVPPDADPDEATTGLKIEVDVAEETEATVTVASATERVQVVAEADLRTSVQLAKNSTKIKVTDTRGAKITTVEVPRSDKRVDIVVDSDGDINTYVPKSIPVEERLEAVKKSAELLVAHDVTSRTVKVSSIVAEKVKSKDLRVDTVDKAKTTTPLDEKLAVSADLKDNGEKTVPAGITENDVTIKPTSDKSKKETDSTKRNELLEKNNTSKSDNEANDKKDKTLKPDDTSKTDNKTDNKKS